MAKQFLVWKDKACNGVNPEWLSLTGKEFYEFIQKEENKGRFFIKLKSFGDGDDEIIIESTEEQFLMEKSKQNRSYYLQQQNTGYKTISAFEEDDDELNEYDKNAVDEKSIEEVVEQAMLIGKLHEALEMLDEDEIEIVKLYYFDNETERTVAEKLGVHYMTLHNRKMKILEKLKKYLVQN